MEKRPGRCRCGAYLHNPDCCSVLALISKCPICQIAASGLQLSVIYIVAVAIFTINYRTRGENYFERSAASYIALTVRTM